MAGQERSSLSSTSTPLSVDADVPVAIWKAKLGRKLLLLGDISFRDLDPRALGGPS